MKSKKGLLTVISLVVILVLSFASMAFAGGNQQQELLANEQQELQTNQRQELQVNEQKNESRQLRLQECEEPCDFECEPQQKRLQKNDSLNEQKQLNRQQKLEERKQLNRMQNNGSRTI